MWDSFWALHNFRSKFCVNCQSIIPLLGGSAPSQKGTLQTVMCLPACTPPRCPDGFLDKCTNWEISATRFARCLSEPVMEKRISFAIGTSGCDCTTVRLLPEWWGWQDASVQWVCLLPPGLCWPRSRGTAGCCSWSSDGDQSNRTDVEVHRCTMWNHVIACSISELNGKTNSHKLFGGSVYAHFVELVVIEHAPVNPTWVLCS